ncbi:MAG TPA: hypothetical protein VFC10_00405 [Terriglobia bacterium]|nr:hypothetical protein [Terriglobia bacterium]
MRLRFPLGLAFATALFGLGGPACPQAPDGSAPAMTQTEKANIYEYAVLLRENLRQEKGEILGAVLGLTPADAKKFWPIYEEYNSELNKLNEMRLRNIKEYAANYSEMTDEKADQLTRQAFEFRKQRTDLLAKYYDRVKNELGASTAARFLQVENQLLSLIDLQIDGHLPVMSHGS